jgi:hypothetical protein
VSDVIIDAYDVIGLKFILKVFKMAFHYIANSSITTFLYESFHPSETTIFAKE